MTQPELVALLAGMSVLFVSFAAAQIVASSALQRRLRVFVRRDPILAPTSVRRQQRQSRVALVEGMNRRLRRATFARQLQKDLIRAGIVMPASRFILLQVAVVTMVFLTVYFL